MSFEELKSSSLVAKVQIPGDLLKGGGEKRERERGKEERGIPSFHEWSGNSSGRLKQFFYCVVCGEIWIVVSK